MARKRVLVVDDSKSARVILSRMLEKYGIEVEMAESAEQAIAYLDHNRPDAIFMDHLMPGMDGLQALHAIKSNPRTAMIPIMMYTSQEGELYVGQARALGAMGVLPKQVRPVDVSKVLYELHLLPDRRDAAESALAPVEVVDGAAVEATVKEQAVDLRRFIVASLDSFAVRIVKDVHDTAPPPPELPPMPLPAPRPVVWPWVAAIVIVGCLGAVCAVFWSQTREELTGARVQLAALTAANADLERMGRELTGTNKQLAAAVAAYTPPVAAPVDAVAARTEAVPYGEIPFDRSRLDVLRDFLAKLEAQNFRGVVKVTSAAGLYCLTGNAADGFAPSVGSLPVNKCDLVGNPFEESLTGQQRQSLAFANLVAGVRQRTAGAITVSLEAVGSSRAAAPYPARTDSVTAGEWNRAAAANNRVDFSAEPSP